MEIVGLSGDRKVQDFLRINDVARVDSVDGVPIFQRAGEFFIGGYKQFYSIAPSIERAAWELCIDRVARYRPRTMRIAAPIACASGLMQIFLLDLHGVHEAQRFEKYTRKARNQVRKSYDNAFSLRMRNDISDAWYALYKKHITRLSGNAKTREWFTALAQALPGQFIIFELLDGDRLIGANVCCRSANYMQLFFQISDPAYWQQYCNNRLYDEMIRYAIVSGVTYLDFGPSLASDKSHNHFKLAFGGQPFTLVEENTGPFLFVLKKYFAERVRALRLRLRI